MTMRRLNSDAEFRAKAATPAIRARKAERMRLMNADPEFRAANAERMRAMVRKREARKDAALAGFKDWELLVVSDGQSDI